jgi:CYTH domain-containing protein
MAIELERTFLAKYIPENLEQCKRKEILDIYIPTESRHPKLRIRKNGNRFEITKKEPLENDPSEMKEETTTLTKEEFDELNNKLVGKRVRKIRYYYPHNGLTAEFDVFQDALSGLIVVDFEFNSVEEKNAFQMPEFCLVDITQEEFIAGGMVCGKSYSDIEDNLIVLDYKKIITQN